MSFHETEFIIEPPNGLKVPKTAILAPTRTIHRAVCAAFRRHPDEDSSNPFSQERLLADCVPLCLSKSAALIGPVVGSSAAVLASEPVLSSGADILVLIGTTGGIRLTNPDLQVGDIVFPRAAFSEEGTSRLYGAGEYQELPPSSFQCVIEDRIKALWTDHGLPLRFHSGAIWTTDAPFRESKEKIEHFSRRGVIGVDMEFSAIARLCAVYQAILASVLVVSDLIGEHWIRGFTEVKRRGIIDLVCTALVEALQEYRQ